VKTVMPLMPSGLIFAPATFERFGGDCSGGTHVGQMSRVS
jgi:hypothetical protein